MPDPGPVPAAPDPQSLGLQPHPEGGWFREVWRAATTVGTADGPRPTATSILFLLQPGERSTWHRVASDELWLWQGGGPLQLTLGGSGAAPRAVDPVTLWTGTQYLVPAGVWQSAAPVDDRAVLVGCVVSPGFDFDDFELWSG